GLGRDVRDRADQDDPGDPTVSDARAVEEHLVGAGRVPGQENAAISASPGEPDQSPDVLDALAEALERRAGQVAATAGDHVVAAVVELEERDAGRVQARRELPRERLTRGEHRPEPVHPDQRRTAPPPGLGDDAVEPDTVARGDARE